MHNEIQIEVLLHISTGTALAWQMDFFDPEYLTLRISDENDLRFGAFAPEEVDDIDSGPLYQAVSARHSKDKSTRVQRIGRKRRTFRDMN